LRRLGGLAAIGLAGCGESPAPPPASGPYVARLVSPNGAEGAAVVQVAALVDSVTVGGGRAFHHSAPSGSRLVLVVDQPGEIRFTLHGVAASANPAFQVIEVADGADKLRPAVAGYRVRQVR
jgi:hypothetical protein